MKTNKNIQIYGHIFAGIIFSSAHRAPKTEQTQGGLTGKMKHKYFILEGESDLSLTFELLDISLMFIWRSTTITEFDLAR